MGEHRSNQVEHVVSATVHLFGDEQLALEWLNTPADFLHDGNPVTPMKLAESEAGARLVESMLRRVAHGFF